MTRVSHEGAGRLYAPTIRRERTGDSYDDGDGSDDDGGSGSGGGDRHRRRRRRRLVVMVYRCTWRHQSRLLRSLGSLSPNSI